jgi:NADH dehydrogenase
VVIIGGGFGGLYVAKALGRAPVSVTLIDRRNFHLFQPLLYQVATGGLSPGEIASPLRVVVRDHRNTQVLLGEVVDLDVVNRRVIMRDGEVSYDTLVVATGATHHYFGNDQWEALAPGLKTIENATEIRSRLLLAFERAEREQNAEERRAWLNFVIVGGGPTGVELAGGLGEIANDTLRHDFRHQSREAASAGGGRAARIAHPEDLSKAERQLIALGAVAARVCHADRGAV